MPETVKFPFNGLIFPVQGGRLFSDESKRCKRQRADMAAELFCVIMAGGSGERFWPLSRKGHPKQFLNLLGRETLIEQTLLRLQGFVPPEKF